MYCIHVSLTFVLCARVEAMFMVILSCHVSGNQEEGRVPSVDLVFPGCVLLLTSVLRLVQCLIGAFVQRLPWLQEHQG